MEIANLWMNMGMDVGNVRIGRRNDAPMIRQLLERAPYTHLHADWHYPDDWLGSPAFVVLEEAHAETKPRSPLSRWVNEPLQVQACLAAAAEPPPAAWVRLAAISEPVKAPQVLAVMLSAIAGYLQQSAVTQLGWLLVEDWPDVWMMELGFEKHNMVETYIKEDISYPEPKKIPNLSIRPVEPQDFQALVAIEERSFDPLWRHSAEGLRLARNQTISFDVAEIDKQVVGFQFSTMTRSGAHLSRMTIDPAFQKRGVGSALLVHAIDGYKKRGVRRISLNTQVDNVGSQRLYQKFGFQPSGQRFPIWVANLGDPDI